MTGECTGLPTAPVLGICFIWVPRWGQVASVFGNLACFLLTEVRWMKAGQHLRYSIPIGAKEMVVSICSMFKIAKHPASHWFLAQRCMQTVQHIALSLTFSLTYTCSNQMLSCLDLAPMFYTISCPLVLIQVLGIFGMIMLQAADDKVMAESMSGRQESITAPSSRVCTG